MDGPTSGICVASNILLECVSFLPNFDLIQTEILRNMFFCPPDFSSLYACQLPFKESSAFVLKVKRRRRANGDVSKIFRHIKEHGVKPHKELFCLPSALATFTPFALRLVFGLSN